MKTLSALWASAIVTLSNFAFAGGEGWLQDFEAAKKQASEEKKSLLVDFTGSDWCGWCIRLSDEVFKHEAFKEGVKDKFVLVELDYPQDSSKLTEAIQKQNAELQETYRISGFPTILLMDEQGRPFARTGYQEGGPEKYVAHLDELLEKLAARDKAFAEAAEQKGAEKAKSLVDALKAMKQEDAILDQFYGDIVKQIQEADPEDTTGFTKSIETNRKFAKFQEALAEIGSQEELTDEDFAKALKLVDETVSSGDFEGEQLQQVVMIKAMILAQSGKLDEAVTTLDEATELAPDSNLAGRAEMFKKQFVEMKAVQEEEAKEEEGKAESE